jgi:hypothetical protein
MGMRAISLVAALLLAAGGAACAAEHGDTLCVFKLQPSTSVKRTKVAASAVGVGGTPES